MKVKAYHVAFMYKVTIKVHRTVHHLYVDVAFMYVVATKSFFSYLG